MILKRWEGVTVKWYYMYITLIARPKNDRLFTYFIDSKIGVEVYDGKILIETRSGDIWLNTKNIVKIDNNYTSISGKASYKSLFTDVILKDGMYKFRFDEK